MIVEYRGVADRQVGSGTAHEVRAFWTSGQGSEGDVKRGASKAVRDVVGEGGSVAFESWDLDTCNFPTLAALIRVRVLTDEQVAARKELRGRRYTVCAVCVNAPPGELVRMLSDGTERPVCYPCSRGLQGKCQVVHWINKDGKVRIS